MLEMADVTVRWRASTAAFFQARNRAIAEAYLAGAHLREVGEQFGISHERVRSILISLGVSLRPVGAPRREAIIAKTKAEFRPAPVPEHSKPRSRILFEHLDALSRKRALTDAESIQMERAMKSLGMI
jgi:hypothetical protein